MTSVERVLAENQRDMPFTLTYLFNSRRHARLACHTGISAAHSAAPELMNLAGENQVWPLSEILNQKDFFLVEDLAKRFVSVPSGVWGEPPSRAILLPITSQTQDIPAGVIVVALNPYRPLDVSYAGFLNLVAGQISASISTARAYEEEKKRAEALAEIDRAKTAFFINVSPRVPHASNPDAGTAARLAVAQPDASHSHGHPATRAGQSQRGATVAAGEHAARFFTHRSWPHESCISGHGSGRIPRGTRGRLPLRHGPRWVAPHR
jgi:hypothetical protein